MNGFPESQVEKIEFDACYFCLFGGVYQRECDKHIICSKNHEMSLQKLTKNSLSTFDKNRRYQIILENKPWKFNFVF